MCVLRAKNPKEGFKYENKRKMSRSETEIKMVTTG
jgi:hypothetical protein